MKPARKMTVALALSLVAVRSSPAQQKRPITPKDCATVADLQADESTLRSTIQISPDSSRVAYPVTSPNLETNENEVKLYVRNMALDFNVEKPVFVGDISQVRWRPDSRHLTFLRRENGQRVIEELDSASGDHRVMFKADSDIPEYSIDSAGTTLVYAADAPLETNNGLVPQEIARGYRISFEAPADTNWPMRHLFVVRRTEDGWTAPTPIIIQSPLSGQPLNGLAHASNSDLEPVLSPDGSKLLVSYWDFSQDMPSEWRTSGYMQLRNSAEVIQAFKLLVLYDVKSGESSLTPLKTPWAMSAPQWFFDGNAFVVAAAPPINSVLEQENIRTHLLGHSAGVHLFWVELTTSKFDDVAPKLADPWAGPLLWDRNGDLFVRVASIGTITRYSRVDGQWRESSSSQIPVRVGTQLATDGNHVIAEYSDTTIPPQLFSYRLGDKQVRIFSKLNPQFETLTLAKPQEVHWKTSKGFHASGLLLLPPNYVKGTKYPLVIQTKPFTSSFVCSFGNFPSFAPQPLANAGIMYLGSIPTKGSTQREEDYYPKGYPGAPGVGGLAEAAFAMDWWDSAVDALDQQGFIDRNRVGMIGFSRTGWYTEFILAHSKIDYRAATVTDNIKFSLGEYWLYHDPATIKSWDLVYGGPPYGATLKNWLDYSVSFNLDKIHAPLLMEEMGSGLPYDNRKALPISLADSFEVFTGLNRLNRPVEMYYYPTESHTPEHPQARLASMQRNVDWYRFWLQDSERPNPEDPRQYVRWRKLRELYQEDVKKTAFTTVNSRSGTIQSQQ